MNATRTAYGIRESVKGEITLEFELEKMCRHSSESQDIRKDIRVGDSNAYSRKNEK